MFPLPSTAMPFPVSSLVPPSKLENNNAEPDAFNLVTKASLPNDPPVPANRIDALLGWVRIVVTDPLHRPLLALVQFVPPFVVLITPEEPTAAYTAEAFAAIELTAPCGTPVITGFHEA